MKRAAGMYFYESNSIARQTAGTQTDTGGLMSSASSNGDTTIATDNWSVATGTITAGTKLTIASVFAVDPETKATLPYLKQFSVTADATCAGGAVTLSISPTIYDSTSSHQNVSALPANNAVVTLNISGTAPRS